MNNRLVRLAEQREYLVALIAEQRIGVSHTIKRWRVPMAMADQGLAAVRLVSTHPVWMVGGLAMFSALGHGRLGIWLWRGLVSWRIIHELRRRPYMPE